MNNPLQAEENYRKAINIGKENDPDLAQESMVQCGLMKEKLNRKMDAEVYYKDCIKLKSSKSPYSDVFVNKARAGIIRISKNS